MKSTNPVFRQSIYNTSYPISEMPMCVSGTVGKLMILSLILLIGAAAAYYLFSVGHTDTLNISCLTALIVSFILALIISFKPNTAPFLSPIYAFGEGILLSVISIMFNAMYPGIIVQAIAVTMLDILVMAVLYKAQIIRATEKFRAVMFAAGLCIMLFYMIAFVLMFFLHKEIAYFNNAFTPAAFAVNLLIAIIASLYLIIDFDNIEKGAKSNLPAYFEWYFSFGLLVTIVWLYLEILRLLARARNK